VKDICSESNVKYSKYLVINVIYFKMVWIIIIFNHIFVVQSDLLCGLIAFSSMIIMCGLI
jgi:hypothetical protein